MDIGPHNADVVVRENGSIIGYLMSYSKHTGPNDFSGLDYWLTYDILGQQVGKMTHTMDIARKQFKR